MTNNHKTETQAIRAFCMDCAQSKKAITKCKYEDCHFYNFRPRSKCKVVDNEHRKMLVDRMKNNRAVLSNRINQKRVVDYKGKEVFLRDLAEAKGVKYETVRTRIKNYGWSVEKAIDTPVRVYTERKK